MGIEFIEKAAPSFKKSWDRARVELATADLFTRSPDTAPRCAVAEIINNARLQVGDRLIVELREGDLIAFQGNSPVAHFTDPPSELVQAVETSCGIAKGTVEQIHDLAQVAEISLC